MNDQQYFHLFSNCIPVKGANRSIVCDLQRNTFEFIPNELYHILKYQLKFSLAEIKATYNHEVDEILEEYFDFLLQKNLGRWVKKIDHGFAQLNLNYETPSHISNCIIDFDSSTSHPMEKVVKELDLLMCQAVQLRCYDPVSITELNSLLDYFEDSKVRGLELVLPFSDDLTATVMEDLGRKHPRLMYILVSGAEVESEFQSDNVSLKIKYSPLPVTSALACGRIDSSYFRVNMRTFTEAKNFNSCLHKKISIDPQGNIMNCPSIPVTYGNIRNRSLVEIVEEEKEFKKLWGIKKDSVKKCRQCEFRYICTDCRAYLEEPSDLLSKPLKCGYDPLTNQWENWTENPIKRKIAEEYHVKGKMLFAAEMPIPS